MNWFLKVIAQSKPMALPSHPQKNDIIGPGYYRIDGLMRDKTAEEIQRKFPGVEYLASGSFGVANNCGNNRVCKLTDDRNEAQFAYYISQNPDPFIIKVYEVYEIQEKPALWLIVSEKVRPLFNEEKKLYEKSRLREIYGEHYEKMDFPNEFYIIDKKRKDLINYLSGQFNYDRNEVHSNNVGWNEQGNLVLLDLGFPSVRSEDAFSEVKKTRNPNITIKGL